MSTINDEITRLKGAKTDLRNSIEAKGVSVDPDFTIDKYSICVDAITQGANLTTLNANQNTTYRPTSPYDGYSEVTVNVQPNLTTLNATSNTTYTPTAPTQGYSSVTVNVQPNLTTLNATSNTTYTPTAPYVGYSSVTVNVGGSNESYLTAYYLNTPETNFTTISDTLFNNNSNVTAVYIDGVAQNSLNPVYRPTDWKVHEIKIVFDNNNNTYSDELFNNVPIVAVDYSHYTGTIFNPLPMQNWIRVIPGNATTFSTDWQTCLNYVTSAATAGTIHGNTTNIGYKYDANSPYDEISTKVLVNKTTHEVVFTSAYNPVDLPAGTTSYMSIGMPGALYVPDTVTDFVMGWGTQLYYFKGTTPPTFQPGGYMDYGVICVPSGCVAAYKAALADTGDPTYADAVREVGVTTVYFTYSSGTDWVYICGADWDGKRIFEIEIYDDQDTLVYSQPYHGSTNLNIPGSALNGYGNYYLKIYYDGELENFLNGQLTASGVTEIDYTGINVNYTPNGGGCSYPELTKITVPSNVDTLRTYFGAYCPNLTEVWLDSPTMVQLDGSDHFADGETPKAQPVKVMVHNKADYENDQAWLDLMGNNLITIDEY